MRRKGTDEGRTDKRRIKGQRGALMRHRGQPAVTHIAARQQNSGPEGPLQSPGGQRLHLFSRSRTPGKPPRLNKSGK